jgi:PHS family inorganic phosphate transporter-like MFS transporter
MMAAVFLMQPLGQLFASVVGLAVLLTVGRHLNSETDFEQAVTVDSIWRYVVGVGAIPALVAIVFRLTIPESPRYTLDVDHDGARALRDTQRYLNFERQSTNGSFNPLGHGRDGEVEVGTGMQQLPRAAVNPPAARDDDADSMRIQDVAEGDDAEGQNEADERQKLPDPFSSSELVQFFWREGNIKYLLGTSSTWFLFDFAFYALGINNPRVLAQIWSSQPIPATQGTTPDWVNPPDPTQSIYDILKSDGIRSIITISIGSMLGSIILIKAINYVPRKAWLAWSFVGMAVLFAVVGGSYFRVANTDLHALTITLYVLCQLLFNLGPNTLTFIIPAEIFPTRYRATCHGISAAAGKLASVIVQAFLPQTKITNLNSKNLGWVLIGFSFAMALGAVCTWAWIPEVQDARGSDMEDRRGRRGKFRAYEVPSKSLETLAVGKIGVEDENMVGLRHRSKLLLSEIREAKNMRRR